MRTFIALTIILLVTVVPVMAQNAADEAAIKKAMDQIEAAWNKHDVKALTALLGENYESFGGSSKGREAFANVVTNMWKRQKDIQWKRQDEVGINFLAPNVAVYKTFYEVTGSLDDNGKPEPPQKSLGAWAFSKKDGDWLCTAFFNRPEEE